MDGCYWHGEEPIAANHCIVCGECGHAFTAEELLRLDNEVAAGFGLPPASDPAEVFCCPLCAHDF